MTQTELISRLQEEVKGLTSYLDTADYQNATDDAINEFGTSFPISGQETEYWVKKRAKRHLMFYLLTESAHKFKFEKINLQNRFTHYERLVKYEDEKFEQFVKDNPALFAGVDTFKMFGTKVDAGFSYSTTGNDKTYKNTENVEFTPKETD